MYKFALSGTKGFSLNNHQRFIKRIKNKESEKKLRTNIWQSSLCRGENKVFIYVRLQVELADSDKVLIDVKSLYRMDELKASGMRFWRL